MITELVAAVTIVLGAYLLYNNKRKRIVNYDYKIGFVKDNLGYERYKIVAKYSKNKEYETAEDIPSIKAGFISEKALTIIKDSWLEKKDAESALEKFKIHLGIKNYKQTIEVE